MAATPQPENHLCLACGLCCNGVIFADVKLQRGDNEAKLKALGLRFAQSSGENSRPKFKQPCSAFDGCQCRIYENRPKYCRAFECLLLKEVNEGSISQAAALRVILAAKSRVREVERLFEKLGECEKSTDLRARFAKTIKKLETTGSRRDEKNACSELTLAMHELNRLLNESFYSG